MLNESLVTIKLVQLREEQFVEDEDHEVRGSLHCLLRELRVLLLGPLQLLLWLVLLLAKTHLGLELPIELCDPVKHGLYQRQDLLVLP